jgi:hypothetical protein
MTAAVQHRQPTLLDAYTPISLALEAAGLRVTGDFANLHPPCVYLAPPEMAFRFHKGDYTATYRLTIMVPFTDRLRAIAQLSGLLTQVCEALHWAPTTATPVDIVTGDQSTALPAMELSWSARIGRTNAP